MSPSPPGELERIEEECDIEFFRASGPGGQHRNKVETAVRLTHRPTGIRVTASERRSQSQNRQRALVRLWKILEERRRPVAPRVATQKPRSARRREIEGKRRRGAVKRERRVGRDEGE